MSKRFFTVLVILMGISLLGIVVVQYYWFASLGRVNKELFGRSVNDALYATVKRLEVHDNIHIVSRSLPDDSLLKATVIKIPDLPPMPIPSLPEDIDFDLETGIDAQVVGQDTLLISVRSGKLNREVAKLRGDIKLRIEELTDSVEEKIGNIEQVVARKALELDELASRVAIEFDSWEEGRTIDENVLKIYLRRELVDKNLPVKFNYAIIAGDSIVKTDMPDPEIVNPEYLYKVSMFPDDIFRRDLKLAVYFPEMKYIFGKAVPGLMILSLIFTLVILLTFTLSIYFIIKQKRVSEMKSDFINNMTHEFKTPIATISVAADSITNEKVISDHEKIEYFAGMIKKENLRMNDQVEKILQIASLDKKDFEFHFKAVDAHQLIMKAIQSAELQMEKLNGRIDINLDAANRVITTDPLHFTNVVYNLLDNAIKYSTGNPEIIVSTANVQKGLLLSVEDKGIGMTKSVQMKIFERFYRQTSGNVHNVKGFGLGLSYVKAVIDANHGSINVKSEPGKGSRFEVFIPFII